jgi:hypothetical protein
MVRASIANSNVIPGIYVPPGDYYRPAAMLTICNSVQPSACMPAIFPGIPPLTNACVCLGTSRPGFSRG